MPLFLETQVLLPEQAHRPEMERSFSPAIRSRAARIRSTWSPQEFARRRLVAQRKQRCLLAELISDDAPDFDSIATMRRDLSYADLTMGKSMQANAFQLS